MPYQDEAWEVSEASAPINSDSNSGDSSMMAVSSARGGWSSGACSAAALVGATSVENKYTKLMINYVCVMKVLECMKDVYFCPVNYFYKQWVDVIDIWHEQVPQWQFTHTGSIVSMEFVRLD